ncbi:MAG: hypothetical protein HY908_06985 [Myxococcales bacterium]|nr:hypothetical protein [Myxococcales bacterium]
MGSEPFELSLLGSYPETLRVLSFRGREAVNALYQVDIHVVCREGPEQPLARAVLERPASLLIHTGAPRAIHGIVAAASLDVMVASAGEEQT